MSEEVDFVGFVKQQLRAEECIKACAGMEDPVKEIAAMQRVVDAVRPTLICNNCSNNKKKILGLLYQCRDKGCRWYELRQALAVLEVKK